MSSEQIKVPENKQAEEPNQNSKPEEKNIVEQTQKILEEQLKQAQKINQNPPQQTIFHDIVDAYSELAKGNIGPILICLQQQQMDVNDKDFNQQTLLHYCALYNLIDLAIYLIKNYKANVNLLNAQKQSALSWACNYSRVEFIKLLADNSTNLAEIINLPDTFNFTNLLYAVRSNMNQIIFQIIYLGGDPFYKDLQGSSIAHWAAFNDNIFLLRFCKRIGVNLNEKDNEGCTPLNRAICNHSYQAYEFLAYENPNSIPYLDEKDQELGHGVHKHSPLEMGIFWESKSLQKISKETKHYNNVFLPLYIFYKGKRALLLNLAYLVLGFFMVSAYYSQETANTYSRYNICFWSQMLFGYLYLNWFLCKVKPPLHQNANPLFKQGKKKKSYDKLKEPDHKQLPPYLKGIILSEYNYMDFGHLNKLLKIEGENDQSINIDNSEQDRNLFDSGINQSFIHEIAILYEAEQYIQLQSLDFLRFCPTCLKYKYPGTKHCRLCNKCVPDQNHHSITFCMCINSSNHIFYLLKQILEEFILLQYFFIFLALYNKYRTSYFVLIGFETAYNMIVRHEFLCLAGYTLALFLLFYNTIYLVVEIVAIMKGWTRNELFNNERYKYLYTPVYHGVSEQQGFYNIRQFIPYKQNIKKYWKKIVEKTRI